MNLILGCLCYLGFVLFRSMRGFEFYHARLVRPWMDEGLVSCRGVITACVCQASQYVAMLRQVAANART